MSPARFLTTETFPSHQFEDGFTTMLIPAIGEFIAVTANQATLEEIIGGPFDYGQLSIEDVHNLTETLITLAYQEL